MLHTSRKDLISLESIKCQGSVNQNILLEVSICIHVPIPKSDGYDYFNFHQIHFRRLMFDKSLPELWCQTSHTDTLWNS